MSYIGNPPVISATRTVTEITATAGQTVFNANGGYTVGFLDVFVNGAQLQSSDFTATNGTSVTLATAATAGDDVRLVAYGTFSVANLTAAAVSDQANTSTGYLAIPKGTTAQRPASPATGMVRYNTTTSSYEVYSGTAWVQWSTTGYAYTANYLVVAGGGGGANFGGAGAGGLLASTLSLQPGTTYTFTVGGGGAAGARGSDSTITASGLGSVIARNDASGYGGQNNDAGGAGVTGQGFAGGSGMTNGTTYNSGGGGGGSGAVGGNSGGISTGVAGVGGAGTSSSITGSAAFYAGGGGGGGDSRGVVQGGNGGSGGGGDGGKSSTSWNATNGTANTGGGGGGAGYNGSTWGTRGQGGSGVIIISVPTANYSGVTTGSPTVTTSGSNTIIRFNASGTYTA